MSNNYSKLHQFKINNALYSDIYEEQNVSRSVKIKSQSCFLLFIKGTCKWNTDLLCSSRTVIEDVMVSMYEELYSSMITIDTKVSN